MLATHLDKYTDNDIRTAYQLGKIKLIIDKLLEVTWRFVYSERYSFRHVVHEQIWLNTRDNEHI